MSLGNYIIVGQILTTHGIQVYLTIKSFTFIPKDIFTYTLYVKIDVETKALVLEDYNFMPKKTIMKIEGVNNIEDCQSYIGKELLVLKKNLPKVAEDEYYWHDLIGSSVINENGIELGYVDSLFSSGENDVLIIKNKDTKKEIFIPFLKYHIISFKEKILTVRWENEV